MRQTGGFAQVIVIELERRGHRRVENNQLVAQHLDLAAAQVVIGGATRALAHHAAHLYAELVTQAFGAGEHIGAIRVADHLHIPLAVAHIDKNHTAMVAPAVDPSTQGNRLTQQGFGHQTAIVGTHGHRHLSGDRHGARRNGEHYFAGIRPSAGLGCTAPIEMT